MRKAKAATSRAVRKAKNWQRRRDVRSGLVKRDGSSSWGKGFRWEGHGNSSFSPSW